MTFVLVHPKSLHVYSTNNLVYMYIYVSYLNKLQ